MKDLNAKVLVTMEEDGVRVEIDCRGKDNLDKMIMSLMSSLLKNGYEVEDIARLTAMAGTMNFAEMLGLGDLLSGLTDAGIDGISGDIDLSKLNIDPREL